MNLAIGVHKTEKKQLQEQQKRRRAQRKSRRIPIKRSADLDDLNLSRVRFARLFDRLTTAF